MVSHVLQSVASSGAGHPVWIRGILAFARAELMMFLGVVPPGAVLSMGLATSCLGTRFPWRGWCQVGF